MLKQPQAPAAPLPPSGSLQAPLPDSSQSDAVAPDQQLVRLCRDRALCTTCLPDHTSRTFKKVSIYFSVLSLTIYMQADLSIADPTVSAPQRVSSSAAADTSLSALQDVQVQATICDAHGPFNAACARDCHNAA